MILTGILSLVLHSTIDETKIILREEFYLKKFVCISTMPALRRSNRLRDQGYYQNCPNYDLVRRRPRRVPPPLHQPPAVAPAAPPPLLPAALPPPVPLARAMSLPPVSPVQSTPVPQLARANSAPQFFALPTSISPLTCSSFPSSSCPYSTPRSGSSSQHQ